MDKELEEKTKLYRAMCNARDYCNTTVLSLEDVARGLKQLTKYG